MVEKYFAGKIPGISNKTDPNPETSGQEQELLASIELAPETVEAAMCKLAFSDALRIIKAVVNSSNM